VEAQSVTNSDLAELLAVEAEEVKAPMVAKALRKASRSAFLWPIEALTLIEHKRSMTELVSVGPYIAKLIERWISESHAIGERPETRKDFLTLTEARRLLAANPTWKSSYKGDLQMHTRASDGSGSINDMAEAAIGLGYEYIGITEHSKGLKIAGGINEKVLEVQGREIEKVNLAFRGKGLKFRVLRSIEMNLNPQGQGDMDSDALRALDVVVGSFHSALRKTEDQTERYLAAIENPAVHILGHPRGRIYNYRLGLKANWKQVFDRAAELGTAIEIDSYPDRQDLNLDLLALARRAGCLIAIDTDAHHPPQLAFVELGLASALKARIRPENILNFQSAEGLLRLIKRS
jgi:histidinol phosphatase-like PHP family hydrolase